MHQKQTVEFHLSICRFIEPWNLHFHVNWSTLSAAPCSGYIFNFSGRMKVCDFRWNFRWESIKKRFVPTQTPKPHKQRPRLLSFPTWKLTYWKLDIYFRDSENVIWGCFDRRKCMETEPDRDRESWATRTVRQMKQLVLVIRCEQSRLIIAMELEMINSYCFIKWDY